MKKITLLTIAFAMSLMFTKAQTAVDFTLTDCNSVSQHLFSILDQQNVVVLVYEHQCGSCTAGGVNVTTVINTFYSSAANVKVIYLDNGGYNCASIANWISTNSLVAAPYIEYSSDYSSPYGSGMPVIVVTGGANHKVYLQANGVSYADTNTIHNAIKTALGELSGINDLSATINMPDIYPNPAKENLTVSFTVSETSDFDVKICNTIGQELYNEKVTNFAGNYVRTIDLTNYAKGTYTLCITSGKGSMNKKIVIE